MSGHPFRIRYEVPLILGGAAVIGAAGRRCCAWLAPLVGRAAADRRSCCRRRHSISDAPMIVEAQLDRANAIGRRAVTDVPAALVRRHDDHGEHGIARALHAGAVAAPASISMISSTKAAARSGTRLLLRAVAVCGMGAGRGGRGRRRHAVSEADSVAGIPGRLRSRLRGRQRGALQDVRRLGPRTSRPR